MHLPERISEHHQAQDHERFAQLGGRVDENGMWPTSDQWLAKHAMPSDVLFSNDLEVKSFFEKQIENLNGTVDASGVTRAQVIRNIFRIADTRTDVISSVRFEQLPAGWRQDGDDQYRLGRIPVSLHDPDMLLPTFRVMIDVSAVAVRYPKLVVGHIEVYDHLIKGLDMPHSITARFLRDGSKPWIVGGDAGSVGVSVSARGKDNAGSITSLDGMYRVADPEAIAQTFDYCEEIVAELFAPKSGEPGEKSIA